MTDWLCRIQISNKLIVLAIIEDWIVPLEKERLYE